MHHGAKNWFVPTLFPRLLPFFAMLCVGCGVSSSRSTTSPALESLTEAILAGDVNRVRKALEANPDLEPNCKPNKICKPLALAAHRGNFEIVKLLIDAGADPNGVNAYGDTAFIVADNALVHTNATPEDVRQLRRYLIEHGTDVNQPNAFGVTPFMGLCSSGDMELVELAFQHGADVNAVFSRTVESDEPDRHSALMWAASEGQKETVVLLLKRGADPCYANTGNETAQDFAESKGHAEIVEMLTAEHN